MREYTVAKTGVRALWRVAVGGASRSSLLPGSPLYSVQGHVQKVAEIVQAAYIVTDHIWCTFY
jgi:hypothetical protein